MDGMDGVLVVDDNIELLCALRCIFEVKGIKAKYATNGKEAVQILKGKGRFEVMITDLHMPEMDGIELARITKEISPSITIVMMSGAISANLPQMAAEAGISKLLAKPFDVEQILDVITSRSQL